MWHESDLDEDEAQEPQVAHSFYTDANREFAHYYLQRAPESSLHIVVALRNRGVIQFAKLSFKYGLLV